MKKIILKLKKRSYDIIIGSNSFAHLPEVIKEMNFKGPIAIVADRTVWKKAKHKICPVLNKLPNDQFSITVPGEEKSKSIDVFRDVIQKIGKRTKRHRPLVVAIGGGVIGDLAGFVASTYRRGVPLVQIPTTLLAQVDSSVGGKVGVDLPEAKNLVGAFYQPKIVIADTDFLKTLPKRQICNGMGEVVKYGMISSKEFFTFLEGNTEKILKLNKQAIEKIIYDCVKMKARIVEKDERDEKDVRIMLNFGHTLGHAIEAAAGYSKKYNHGEAVALGMILAGEIALRFDMLKEKEFIRMKALLKKIGLPERIQKVGVEEVMKAYSYDKKFVSGTTRLILPRRIGKVEVVEDIPELPVRSALSEYVE
ncbi:MAG: 3-dehydroquinate synthase [Candidatus Aadella gelida]|nr:3-dehydroquinate synthase [Candidatus Aadella gelida]